MILILRINMFSRNIRLIPILPFTYKTKQPCQKIIDKAVLFSYFTLPGIALSYKK